MADTDDTLPATDDERPPSRPTLPAPGPVAGETGALSERHTEQQPKPDSHQIATDDELRAGQYGPTADFGEG